MKKILRLFLNKLGYDFIKINVHSDAKASKIKNVKVGNFILSMPGNNPQISTYKYDPTANCQLASLCKIVHNTYNDLYLIDVGANVGDTIAVVKSIVDIPIIAFEGDDISYSFLEKNTNQFNNIFLEKKYLGEKNTEIAVSLEKKGWNTTLIPSDASENKIQVTTLDNVISTKYNTMALKVLKIDTEGFDTIILRGAHNFIKKHKPVLYFEFNRENMEAINENGLKTLFELEQFGYKKLLMFDNKGNYLLQTSINEKEIIEQVYYYTGTLKTQIAYIDICLFHQEDEALFYQYVSEQTTK